MHIPLRLALILSVSLSLSLCLSVSLPLYLYRLFSTHRCLCASLLRPFSLSSYLSVSFYLHPSRSLPTTFSLCNILKPYITSRQLDLCLTLKPLSIPSLLPLLHFRSIPLSAFTSVPF